VGSAQRGAPADHNVLDLFLPVDYGQDMTEGYRSMNEKKSEDERAGWTQPSQDEQLQSVEFSLRFDSAGKATNAARDAAIRALAGRVVEHLERSNYIVMRRAPARSWSTPGKFNVPMKD
jgi:hypothetical protein